MNRFRTSVFAAALVGLAGGLLLLTPGTDLLGQDKKNDLDLGVVNLAKLKKADIVVPAKGVKTPEIGLKAFITGQVAKGEKLPVYVAVDPLFGDTNGKIFWVQKMDKRDGVKFKSDSQFGEEDSGKGEYFAIVAFTSKSEFAEGDQIDIAGIEKNAASCSKVLVVKRTK